MKEDFIDTIQFDLFKIEIAIGDVALLSLVKNYIDENTISDASSDDVIYGRKNAEWVEVSGGGESLWEVGEGDILLPKLERTFTIKKAYEVDPISGDVAKFLNEQGDFATIDIPTPISVHNDLTNRDADDAHPISSITDLTETLEFLEPLYFFNKSATFAYDNTQAGYPYKAEFECIGVTGDMVCDVALSLADAVTGKIAPICESGIDKVVLYAKESIGTIQVPTIRAEKV
jgi:hypothetical protein